MSITVNGTTGLNFPDGTSQPTAGFAPFRNRIINGDMRIDQRNAGASATIGPSTSSDYRVDRFFIQRFGGTAVFSGSRSTTAPAGFTNSLNVNVTTAAAPSTANDSAFIRHHIEGFNVADLAWGTAAAAPVTLSFWVRSSVTGNYAGGITNGAPDRTYVFTYTISQANTWEYKTVTIPGDTTGTWNKDNSSGMRINFDLGSGTTFNGTAGTWAAGNAFRTSSTGIFMNNSGASFFITGVQLEKGSSATAFEFRPYGTELTMCQRYYEKSFDHYVAPQNGATTTTMHSGVGTIVLYAPWSGSGQQSAQIPFKVEKRVAPSMTKYGSSDSRLGYLLAGGFPTSQNWGTNGGSLNYNANINISSYNTSWAYLDNQAAQSTLITVIGGWAANAEL